MPTDTLTEVPRGGLTVASTASTAGALPNGAECAPTPAVGDRELLAAYVSGEEPAFEKLVTKYSRMLYGVALRYVGDPQIAEEVVQSTFIILARKASTLPKEASVCGWLLRTAGFVARDALKTLRRRKQNESELSTEVDGVADSSPNGTAMAAVLEEALLSLTAAEHDCLVARFYEDKSFKEIGAWCAISEDAAQKRVSRSLAKVRAFLEKRGIKAPLASIPGMLLPHWLGQSSAHVAQSFAKTVYALVKGKAAGTKAAALADHALRSLWWHSRVGLCLSLGVPAILLLGGVWTTWEWSKPPAAFQVPDPRIESLGKAWAQIDLRVMRDRQQYLPTPRDDPRFQEVVREAQAITDETWRIAGELAPLLTQANDRTRVAEFLTVELRETLALDPPQQRAVFSWMSKRLAQGSTLQAALKTLAQSASTEAAEIRAMLPPAQRQVFDQTYGADGLGLFSYAKTVISKPVTF